MVHQVRYSVALRESLSHLSVGWLAFVGGLIVALIGTAMMVTQLVSDSGDNRSNAESGGLIGRDGPFGPFRPGASFRRHAARAGGRAPAAHASAVLLAV